MAAREELGSTSPSGAMVVFPGNMYTTRAGSRHFFGAFDTTFGGEIWSTDGTVGGTLALDSVPGPAQGVLGLTRHAVVHLDPTTAVGVAIVVPGASGQWNASIAMPSAPTLIGLDLVAQPFFLAPTPIGLDVGHAFWLPLGP